MVLRHLMVALSTAIWLGAAAPGQFQFNEVGGLRGIEPYQTLNGKGGGVAAADYDDDGDVDLFIPTATGVPDQLYRNLGDGSFEEIAALAGVDALAGSRSALWFDYDGDHRLDLFVAGDCWNALPECPDTSTLRLYRQLEDGTFLDTTIAAGILDDLIETTDPHRGGASAGDLNNDGWLDLVTGLWFGFARVFLNSGDGTFEEISESSGVGIGFGSHWQPVVHDFNRDGWMDFYIALDFTGNRHWINQGDLTFVDRAVEAGTANSWNDMGLAFGDYDNDGDFDFYVTNITNSLRHNVLYRNDSVGDALTFVDVSEDLEVHEGGWGWGTTFLDADNDGWLDLAATNGWFNGVPSRDPSRFYLNVGSDPVAFADVSDAVGFNDTLWGSCVVAFDLERDGDLDLVQSCNSSGATPGILRVLENQPDAGAETGHHLVVRPRMSGTNHRAIGAVVRITAGGLSQRRLITAGTSHMGQEPAEAFFGLADTTLVDELVVEWPGGGETTLQDVAVDQVLTVNDGGSNPADVDGDGLVGVGDLLLVILSWGPCGASCPGDIDGDGVVGSTDLVIVITSWS